MKRYFYLAPLIASAALVVSAAIAAEVTVSVPDAWPSDLSGWSAVAFSVVWQLLGVSGLTSAAMAFLPQGADGTFWDGARTLLNKIAFNVANARNIRTVV